MTFTFDKWKYTTTGVLIKPNGTACSARLDTHGYKVVSIQGKKYKQHRVIFFLMTGTWPEQVDHKDRDRANNAPLNLRAADNSINGHNKAKLPSNTSGTKGVNFVKQTGKWRAIISVQGNTYTKRFDTKDEAITQRKQWEQHYDI